VATSSPRFHNAQQHSSFRWTECTSAEASASQTYLSGNHLRSASLSGRTIERRSQSRRSCRRHPLRRRKTRREHQDCWCHKLWPWSCLSWSRTTIPAPRFSAHMPMSAGRPQRFSRKRNSVMAITIWHFLREWFAEKPLPTCVSPSIPSALSSFATPASWGAEDIVSKRLGSRYRSDRSPSRTQRLLR